MKKLIFVLSLIGIISTGYGQKISTLVEDGDTITTLTNDSYISLSELDGTPSTVAIRLLPMFTDIDADVAALDTRADTDSVRIDVNDAKVTNATHTGDVTGSGALTIGNDKVLEAHLKAVNSPTDEYALTYESTTGDFEWQAGAAADATARAMFQDSVEWVNVTAPAYGADKTGAADSEAAIELALDALVAQGGGILYFPQGTYRIDDAVSKSIDANIDIKIIGDNAKIDATNISSYSGSGMFWLYGADISTGSMSAVASMDKGDEAITTAADMSLSAGDIFRLVSTDLWTVGASFYQGELCQVQSVTNDTVIALTRPLRDTYTAANVTMHTKYYPSISIEGIEFEADLNLGILVHIENSRNTQVRNCEIHGARYTGLSLKYNFGGVVDQLYSYDTWYTGTGTSYNVQVQNSQNVTVEDCNLLEARHNISTGGPGSPSRDLIYKGNVCIVDPRQASVASIDVHGNAEYVTIIDNHASGISVLGSNTAIRDNTVITNAPTTNDIIAVIPAKDSDYYIINGNTVKDDNASSSASFGITIKPSVANIDITRLEIKDNNIQAGWGMFIQPSSSAATSFDIQELVLDGNRLNSVTNYPFAIYDNGAAKVGVDDFISSNNIYYGDGQPAFRVLDFNYIKNTTSTNDIFFCGGNNQIIFEMQDSCGANLKMYNPQFRGASAALDATTVVFGVDSICEIHNAIYSDMATGIVLGVNMDLYIENGKRLVNASSTVTNSGSVPIINEYKTVLTGSLTDGTPTDAEIDGIVNGTPAVVESGAAIYILDSDGSTLMYKVISDGTNWQYEVLTIAL